MNNRRARRRAAKLARKNGHGSLKRPALPARASSAGWQGALLGTVAAGAIVATIPSPVSAGPDGCTLSGRVAICEGDQSDGVTNFGGGADFTSPPIKTVKVRNLNQDIDVTNFPGILMISADDITITSDTGNFKITGSGGGGFGIYAYTLFGDTKITAKGDIDTSGIGADAIAGIGGGAITISHTGDLKTRRLRSAGIYAFSPGSTVTVDQTGGITTTGERSPGILALGLNRVTVTQTGDISTRRDDSDGIYGYSYAKDVKITQSGDVTTRGRYSYGVAGYADDGSVKITQTGNISTHGRFSNGVFANGPDGVTITQTGDIRTKGFDGDGIYAISRRTVSISQTGNITTQRHEAEGILAYSRNGPIIITQTGNVRTRGIESDGIAAYARRRSATITHTGNVVTKGHSAFGLIANAGDGRNATITVKGNITTFGNGSDGVHGDSDGNGSVTIAQMGDVNVFGRDSDAIDVDNDRGMGTSLVTIHSGSDIVGGRDRGDGVDIDGGRKNRIINYGSIRTRGEFAIQAEEGGSETVRNFGVVTGDVDLERGRDFFDNRHGGVFDTGKTVFLGRKDWLRNAGTVNPGGRGNRKHTELTGKFEQTERGTFAVDVNSIAGKSDRLKVSGKAIVDGTVLPIHKKIALKSGTARYRILSAKGGIKDKGIKVDDGVVVDYELRFPNANNMFLTTRLDFAPNDAGLTANQRATGRNLNQILKAGVPANMKSLYRDLLKLKDNESFAEALDQLHAEPYLAAFTTTYFATETYAKSLMSCPTADNAVFVGAEGQCVWAAAHGRTIDKDRSAATIGYSENAAGLGGGMQFMLGDMWRAGLGLGYERATGDIDTRAETKTDRFHVGGSLKGRWGATTLTGVLVGGMANTEIRRKIRLPGFSRNARSDQDVQFATARIRFAHSFNFNGAESDTGTGEGWYVRPLVDVGATFIELGGLRERGAGGTGLALSGSEEWILSAMPGVEVGGQYALTENVVFQPYGRIGVTFLSNDAINMAARFRGAPAGVGPFTVYSDLDDVFANVDLGANFISSNGASLKINYAGMIGEDAVSHAGGVKLRWNF